MNKSQRRGKFSPHRNDSLNRFKQGIRGSNPNGTYLPSRLTHGTANRPSVKEKNVANRCCFITPVMADFGQCYDDAVDSRKEYKDTGQVTHQNYKEQLETLLQNDYESVKSEKLHLPKVLKSVSCGMSNSVKNSSLHAIQSGHTPPSDGTPWLKVDSIESVDKVLAKIETKKDSKNDIYICEAPNIKVIAEKFSKYKRNNLEVRQLEEKVVCVEYDIFDKSANGSELKPVQKMRAFFSIKPSFGNNSSETQDPQAIPRLPSNIKNKFDVLDEDLEKLTDKEIEFIDAKIEENKPYLEDLRRILKRKQVINAKKNKTSLDLPSLYEMAKSDRPPLNCDFSHTNFLSKAELQEVKDLILQRCTSSVHGFRRRRLEKTENNTATDVGVIYESIVAELLRDDAKLNV